MFVTTCSPGDICFLFLRRSRVRSVINPTTHLQWIQQGIPCCSQIGFSWLSTDFLLQEPGWESSQKLLWLSLDIFVHTCTSSRENRRIRAFRACLKADICACVSHFVVDARLILKAKTSIGCTHYPTYFQYEAGIITKDKWYSTRTWLSKCSYQGIHISASNLSWSECFIWLDLLCLSYVPVSHRTNGP